MRYSEIASSVQPSNYLTWVRGSKYHLETVPKRFTIAAYYSSKSKDYMAWDCQAKPHVNIGIERCVALDDGEGAAAAIGRLKRVCQARVDGLSDQPAGDA